MKLWQKNYNADKEIERFTVGNDYLLDKNLIKYDVYGSIAHSSMLKKIKILNNIEFNKIKKELKGILKLNEKNNFKIKLEDEDVHTAIENHLVKKLGSIGKKVHTARSRNDQILVDLRLYSKENLLEVSKALIDLISITLNFAEKNKNTPMAGYSHAQKAMPSSIGLLFGAYAESLLDNFELIGAAYMLNNQNPLGSAAGYGTGINIDRNLTAKLLGFDKVQNNTLYVQNSKGKIESSIIFSLSKIMQDLEKISNDLILFSMDEFNYFNLPDKFTTGSSIMPNKKNPDVLELVRAKSSVVESLLFQANSISKKTLSGYNRDSQLIKEPLMQSFKITLDSVKIMSLVIKGLEVNEKNCINSCANEIFATDELTNLIKLGVPMREAYKKIANNLNKVKKQDAKKNILEKKHIGATGNLNLKESKDKLKQINSAISLEDKKLSSALSKLVK